MAKKKGNPPFVPPSPRLSLPEDKIKEIVLLPNGRLKVMWKDGTEGEFVPLSECQRMIAEEQARWQRAVAEEQANRPARTRTVVKL